MRGGKSGVGYCVLGPVHPDRLQTEGSRANGISRRPGNMQQLLWAHTENPQSSGVDRRVGFKLPAFGRHDVVKSHGEMVQQGGEHIAIAIG